MLCVIDITLLNIINKLFINLFDVIMNLKTIFCGMCAALIMMSCAESVTQYTINGVWPEGNGETVYLKTVNGKVILDSAVVADGRYKMQKPFTGTALRVLEM